MAGMLRLRPATASDAGLLFDWVNDPQVRGASFSTAPIIWPEHVGWLEARLADKDSAWLWIAEAGDRAALGQIRFQREGDGAVVSFSVAAAARGRGYGRALLTAGCGELLAASGISTVFAYVKPDNLVSKRTLARAGFNFRHSGEQNGCCAELWATVF